MGDSKAARSEVSMDDILNALHSLGKQQRIENNMEQ